MLHKLISGGQTGVDRAALDVALELGIPCGGWCPHGRKAEDGVIPRRYSLKPTRAADYSHRTKRNVLDADATLIITRGDLTGGTALTLEIAQRNDKPCLVADLDSSPDIEAVSDWLLYRKLKILNCAGPRESRCPGIYDQTLSFLRKLLPRL